jgi:putative tricarboxylic transport membrane protein
MLRAVTINRSVVIVLALILSMVGVFSLRNSMFDVMSMMVFGLLGYFMLRYGYSTAAFALALILGEQFEGLLRRGLLLEDSSWTGFMTRPVTAVMVAISVALLVYGVVGTIRTSRRLARAAERQEERAAVSTP